MKRVLHLLSIHREERLPAAVSLLLFTVLNVLTVARYYGDFSELSTRYHRLFVDHFRLSGFDPLTYEVVSSWTPAYNVYRHPLLAFFIYVPNQLNQILIHLTGMNFATIVVALLLVVSAVYSFVFLYRIFTRVIGISRFDALLLSALFFSFAYVELSIMAPDHFALSLTLLLLTLYLCGRKQESHSVLKGWETVMLFVLTAGVSLNNGLKTFIAALFTNKLRFFRPAYLLLCVLFPALLMWGFARWEYRKFVWPKEMARKEARAQKSRMEHQKILEQYRDTAVNRSAQEIQQGVNRIIQQRAQEKYRRDHRQPWNMHKGTPIAKGEFSRWTDISTPRWESCVENLFGESVQLHEDHLLEDVLRKRPVIVHYSHWWNYLAESVLMILFAVGIWCGRKERFLWMVLAFFALDMVLHVGLGFGLNEVYIMSAHWIYALPIAMAYIFRRSTCTRILPMVRWVVLLLTLFLYVHNLSLIFQYMTA